MITNLITTITENIYKLYDVTTLSNTLGLKTIETLWDWWNKKEHYKIKSYLDKYIPIHKNKISTAKYYLLLKHNPSFSEGKRKRLGVKFFLNPKNTECFALVPRNQLKLYFNRKTTEEIITIKDLERKLIKRLITEVVPNLWGIESLVLNKNPFLSKNWIIFRYKCNNYYCTRDMFNFFVAIYSSYVGGILDEYTE